MTIVLYILLLLADHQGQVLFGGVPVPGATVTATQADKKFVVITDLQGAYSFPDLADGPFTVQVEMLGFSTVKQEVTTPTAQLELKMLPMEEIHAEVVHAAAPASAPPPTAPAANVASNNGKPAAANGKQPAAPARPAQAGFQRAQVNETGNAAPAQADAAPAATSGAFANVSQADLNSRAADGLVINGTVNNGAASPFAQLAAFGNNRRGRPLYNGNFNFRLDNSALDARTYSLTGQNTAKPPANQFTGSFIFGGPLKTHNLLKVPPQFNVQYSRTENRTANNFPGRMPTSLERSGDFSQTTNLLGQPVQIIDPLTGQPFQGDVIPQYRISPQAQSLLNLFPQPNSGFNGRYNYQVALVPVTHSDSFNVTLNKQINNKNQISGNFSLQSNRSGNPTGFNFNDTSRSFGITTAINYTNRPTQRFSMQFRYQFSRFGSQTTPYFANRINVSGIAGITGNNQDAVNWGPPTLAFSGGTSSLSDQQYSNNRIETNTLSYNSFWNHGRHSVTFGGDVRRQEWNNLAQQDPRGTFTFTGAATGAGAVLGADLADFLLGIPDTSSIAFGNADKYLRQTFYDAFLRDDFRMSGALTIQPEMRWEYDTPTAEKYGRLVNLNLGPGFSTEAPVVGNNLVKGEKFFFQPRLSFAWRPVAASSLIVRGGYGIYRNQNVYLPIANQMVQQSPLSKSLSVPNTPANPLTIANGFVASPNVTTNTFAIDPNFKIGFVQTWQLSIQRDLPAALQMTALYLGTQGSRLPQEFLPNTYPAGAVSPTGPSGYAYLTSNGHSIRHSGQVQLRRRLRSGFTASAQYTFAKAIDDAPLMASTNVVTGSSGGSNVAQNWLNLRAERALSNFDQRHQLQVSGQYTTGVGVRGGTLLSGWKGAMFKDWTVGSALTIGSGTPLNPGYTASVAGTGVTGSLRPDLTGAPIYAAPAGLFLNPAAFRIPAAGQWGNAGRNTITGPSQFSLNANMVRTFRLGDRYNMDLNVSATNVLNHVTFANWTTSISSGQFGLPAGPNAMRSIQTSLRLRF
jgi:hypothetical protein